MAQCHRAPGLARGRWQASVTTGDRTGLAIGLRYARGAIRSGRVRRVENEHEQGTLVGMSIKAARTVEKKRLLPGTSLTIKLDSGQSLVVHVVEDLGDIGHGGRRLLRVSSDADPSAPGAAVFDVPLDLSALSR